MKDNNELGHCATCASRCPEMCERCTYVEAPDGSQSKPTNYVYFDGISDLLHKVRKIDTKKGRYAKLIELYVKRGSAVPLRLVLAYNRCTENMRDEN